MLEILKAVVYGIVEGITEWLPVSSTGHMILLEKIMPMEVSEEFWGMFLVVVQLGAILAVVLMFWNKIFPSFLSKGENRLGYHGTLGKNFGCLYSGRNCWCSFWRLAG